MLLLSFWLSGHLPELRDEGEDKLAIAKSVRSPLREILITESKWQFKWGFVMLLVTTAGRLREWSQAELGQ